ncbi:MAG: glycosyltransferase family 4 protein [Opitutaceae bacterium]|nr:glycosyltransferase family 4 protein [Opitutaceae bacterium]
MKTVLLCPELFAREGGIQRILRLYLKALGELARADGEVRLVVLNDREFPVGPLRRYADETLTQQHACARRKPLFVWRTLQCAAGADRMVCGHIGQLPVAWLAQRLYPRLQYFLVAHGIEVWRPYTCLERIALRGVRRILCVSEYTRGEVQRRTGLPEAQFAVVPNALDPDFADRPEDGTAGGEPVILTVARLDAAEAYKGVDHLIAAMPAVRQAVPAARLRIVGTGNDLPRLHELADRLGVAGAVEFAGLVDEETLRDAYRACTLFALPSRKEGFGLVFLEAMAHGKPCLGARAGATPEIIDDTSGVLVDFGDVPQITRQVVWALQHPWNPVQIWRRAAQFSYGEFKLRLQAALAL